MAILPVLSLLYAVFALSMATETITNVSPDEAEVQLSEAPEAMTDGGEPEVQLSEASEAKTDGGEGEAEVQLSEASGDKAVGAAYCTPRSARRRQCASGWRLIGNRCFKYFAWSRTWAQAEAICVSRGGHLASIHTRHEAWMAAILSGKRSWIWLGGSRANAGPAWKWTDDTAFNYANWQIWQPDMAWGKEHCIHANYKAPGAWNDLPCNARIYFLCAN